jgi:hypothetical protein
MQLSFENYKKPTPNLHDELLNIFETNNVLASQPNPTNFFTAIALTLQSCERYALLKKNRDQSQSFFDARMKFHTKYTIRLMKLAGTADQLNMLNELMSSFKTNSPVLVLELNEKLDDETAKNVNEAVIRIVNFHDLQKSKNTLKGNRKRRD